MALFRDQTTGAVLAFLDAQTWAQAKQIVEKHRNLLLTDAADVVLADLLTQHRDNEEVTHTLQTHRMLLTRCRREGIDAAFADHLPFDSSTRLPSAEWDQINAAVTAFIFAQTWAERKRIVENHPNLLLNDTADAALAAFLTQFRDDKDGARTLEEYRKVLARCRREGIDAAFADRLYLDR